MNTEQPNNEPLGVLDGNTVLCFPCAKQLQKPEDAVKIYPENLGQYRQTCGWCGTVLAEGLPNWPILFDGVIHPNGPERQAGALLRSYFNAEDAGIEHSEKYNDPQYDIAFLDQEGGKLDEIIVAAQDALGFFADTLDRRRYSTDDESMLGLVCGINNLWWAQVTFDNDSAYEAMNTEIERRFERLRELLDADYRGVVESRSEDQSNG